MDVWVETLLADLRHKHYIVESNHDLQELLARQGGDITALFVSNAFLADGGISPVRNLAQLQLLRRQLPFSILSDTSKLAVSGSSIALSQQGYIAGNLGLLQFPAGLEQAEKAVIDFLLLPAH